MCLVRNSNGTDQLEARVVVTGENTRLGASVRGPNTYIAWKSLWINECIMFVEIPDNC